MEILHGFSSPACNYLLPDEQLQAYYVVLEMLYTNHLEHKLHIFLLLNILSNKKK